MKSIKKYAAALVVMAVAIGMMGCKTQAHVHSWELTSIITPATCVTKGEGEYKCSGCEETKIDEIPELYSSPVDAETGNKATSTSPYVYFGVFPKTIKASDITVDETVSVTIGANTYFKGNDGEWYAKVTANPYSSAYTYSDNTKITQGNIDYFKVEPIKWKVLTKDYNGTKKALLLAEEILTSNVPYYEYNSNENTRTVGSDTGIYPNNYKYSQIRAYLNGLDYYYDTSSSETTKKTDYTDNGFLQTAFTAGAQALIEDTEVVNDGVSTSDALGSLPKADGTSIKSGTVEGGDAEYYPDYTCANTTDKIFLLSEQEVTTTAYGFARYSESGQGNARIRFTTDYAKANFSFQNTTSNNGGWWWLRSPFVSFNYCTRCVYNDGHLLVFGYVDYMSRGIVPALTISLK